MGDEQEPKTHEVANPEYEALEELKRDVVKAQDDLGTALKSSATAMQDQSAWTGATTAETFTTEVSGRSTHLPGLVEQILTAVEDRMAEVPKTLTVSDHPAGSHGPARAI